MENVILSDVDFKEISKLCPHISCKKCPDNTYGTDYCGYEIRVAKKAQQKLLRILKEPCTEHPLNKLDSPKFGGISYPHHRYLCPDCLAEIEKEIEG